MIEVVTHDVEEVARKFKALRAKLLAESEKGMGRALLFLKGRVQEGIRSGSMVEGQRKPVRRRSGLLSGSVNTRTELRGFEVYGFIGSHAPQSRLLDKGGTVVPKSRKWLTIPVPGGPVLTGAGVPRGRARDFDLRFVPDPNDKMRAFLMGGDSKNPVLYYVLKKQVEIPEHKWLSGPVDANRPKVMNYIDKSAEKAIKESGL